MTLNTRDRSVLFESLSKLADPEAVDAMLAHFPTRDVDEPLTRDYLDSRLIEFREEIRLAILTEFRAFDAKLASLDAKLTSEIGSLRQDMTSEVGSLDAKIGSLRQDMTAEIGTLRQDMAAEIGTLRGDLDAKLHRSLQWTVATMIALATVMTAVVMIFS